MAHDMHIMLAKRQRALQKRNKEIEKQRMELEQEFNMNKQEIEDTYVKLKKAEAAMSAWKGITHGQN